MSEIHLKVGDVVKLKSGSCNMTIISVFDSNKTNIESLGFKLLGKKSGSFICQWMNTIGELQTNCFSPEVLELISTDKK